MSEYERLPRLVPAQSPLFPKPHILESARARVPQSAPPSAIETTQRQRQSDLRAQFARPPLQRQRQSAHVFQALALQRALSAESTGRLTDLQSQVSDAGQRVSPQAISDALQRQAQRAVGPAPLQGPPASAAEWIRAAQLEVQRVQDPSKPDHTRTLSSAQMNQHKRVLQSVSQQLVQRFRSDRAPAGERHQVYGEHLASLQRHSLTRVIPRVFLTQIPAAERPAVQRCLDAALQRLARQDEQDQQALGLHALQRQLQDVQGQGQASMSQRLQARRGSGTPLPETVQRQLEAGLNHSMGGVRIHDDAEADALTKSVHAVAFTSGQDIYFRSGKYQPNTQTGLELVAHEATHVKQQARGQVGRGIDPDAGLERQAQAMGKKIAFGTTAPRNRRAPGSLTMVRAALPQSQTSVAAAPAIQRWPNPFSGLKKAAQKARARVSSVVRKVTSSAKQVVKRTVSATQKTWKRTASGARRQLKKASSAVRHTVRRVSSTARRTWSRVATSAKRHWKQGRSSARRAWSRVTRSARRRWRQGVTAARRTVRRVSSGARHTWKAVKTSASRRLRKAVSGAKRTWGNVKAGAGRAARGVAAFTSRTLTHARNKLRAVRAQAARMVKRVSTSAKAHWAQAKAGVRRMASAARGKWQALKAKGKATWKKASAYTKAKWNVLSAKVKAVVNSPRTKAIGRWLKKAGIQVAKVGAAIVVGGVVIAGAAALTAATGGLAGPALVAALFASGALGGAASQVVGNALEGKKLGDGISARSVMIDGLLGVAAGPAAKLVGGLARTGIKGVGRVVGPRLGAVAGKMGGTANRMLLRYAPQLQQALGRANTAARTRLAAIPGQLGRLPARIGASRVGQFARRAASRSKTALNRVGNRLGRTWVGRGLRAADNLASRGLRTVTGVPARVGGALGRGIRGAKNAARRIPAVRRASQGVRNSLERLKDRVAVVGLKARTAVTSKAKAGWTAVRTKVGFAEDRLRNGLASRGLNINPNVSVSERVFASAERNLAGMKNYVTAEAHTISTEIRDSFYGSGGVGGVLRTGKKMEDLVAANPALRRAWDKELSHAARGLTNRAARNMRRQELAAGRILSRPESRRAVSSQLTPDAIRDFALRNVRGKFMTTAAATYRSRLPSVTGFDPQRGWFGQIPGLYGAGLTQMAAGARKKLSDLKATGSVVSGVATAGGWISEETFKTFSTAAGKYYRAAPQDRQGTALEAGVNKLSADGLKPVVKALTGIGPEAQGGPNMLLTPFDQQISTTTKALGIPGKSVGHEEPKLPDPGANQLNP